MSSKSYGNPEEIRERIRHNQKKLIPLNIFVMILALVSAITLLVAPLLTVDLAKASDVVAIVMKNDSSETDSDSDSDTTAQLVSKVLEKLDLKIKVSTLSVAKFAFSDDPVGYLLEGVSVTIKETLTEFFKDEKALIDIFVPYVLDMLSNEGINTDNINVDKLYEKLKDIEKATTSAAVDTAISAFVDELQSQLGSSVISADDKGELVKTIREFYDNTMEHVDEFTLQACICINVSILLNESREDGEAPVYYTTYEELIDAVSQLLSSMDSEADVADNANNALQGSTTSTITSSVDLSEYEDMLNDYLVYIQYFVYVMFFFIGIWALLFLFAGLHLLLKNKRFVMWYVKLFGFIPCLLFGVAPTVAKILIPSLIGEGTEVILAVLGMISSLTWISGACYILLWLVSIFWAFPIKRKIRRDKKELKRAIKNS